MTDPQDIHVRLVSLCALVSGVNTAEAWWRDNDSPYTAAELVAIVVVPTPTISNTSVSDSIYESTQEWLLTALVQRFPADYKLRDRDTWNVVRPYLRSIPNLFHTHRNLELNDNGIVKRSTLPALESLSPVAFDRALYAAAGFRMSTTTVHRA